MSKIPKELAQFVRNRAGSRCEYCGLLDGYATFDHQIDHIRAKKHEGKTNESNLCLSCHWCNRHKGSDQAAYDPITDALVPLFNPRYDHWKDHFKLEDAYVAGISACGRATVRLLRMNDDDAISLRAKLIELGLFP